MKYNVLLIPFVLLVACSSASSESSIQTAIAQTQAAQPTEAPTLSPEQAYVSKIEPAVNDLKEWISGPLFLFEESTNTWLDDDGNVVEPGHEMGLPAIDQLSLFWKYPLSVSGWPELHNYMVESIAPAAKVVTTSGFSVQSSFDSITPPSSIKTAHDQITSCVQYKVETIAEIERSIMTNYFIPNFQESDPCNLLDTALAILETYIEENR